MSARPSESTLSFSSESRILRLYETIPGSMTLTAAPSSTRLMLDSTLPNEGRRPDDKEINLRRTRFGQIARLCLHSEAHSFSCHSRAAGIGCAADAAAGLVRGALTASAEMAPAIAKAASQPIAGLKPEVKLPAVPIFP